jgi:hypothetical protein
MSEETGVKKMTAADVSWHHYPHLDTALETESPAVLASIERTCRGLDRLLQAGTERERERARAALVAYARALELYHRLVGLRDDALRTASNMRRGIAINV